jgi:hypothetical protein
VFIDELDAHLHSQWQEMAVPLLGCPSGFACDGNDCCCRRPWFPATVAKDQGHDGDTTRILDRKRKVGTPRGSRPGRCAIRPVSRGNTAIFSVYASGRVQPTPSHTDRFQTYERQHSRLQKSSDPYVLSTPWPQTFGVPISGVKTPYGVSPRPSPLRPGQVRATASSTPFDWTASSRSSAGFLLGRSL